MALLGAASITGVPAFGFPKITSLVGGILNPIFSASPLWSTRANRVTLANPHQAERIFVICDNASYYRSREVREFTDSSKIELVFLPPYSPNLNLIERFWKFFKKRISTTPTTKASKTSSRPANGSSAMQVHMLSNCVLC
jgi:hypothetical protein